MGIAQEQLSANWEWWEKENPKSGRIFHLILKNLKSFLAAAGK